jgi:hypothetical protein
LWAACSARGGFSPLQENRMADIQHLLQIAAPAETIYPLVTTGKGFSQWWAADVIESNNTVELGFFNRATTYRLRIASS